MSYTLFDPTTASDLATFQGTYAGLMAGNASTIGVGTASTSVYNQAGYYAVQDADTGYVTLQKLADDSLYTNQWYDQSSNTIFDFSAGGSGVTSLNETAEDNEDDSAGLEEYLYGTGYVASTYSSKSTTSTTSATSTEETDETDETDEIEETDDEKEIELTAADLQELVDAGIYDNLSDALKITLANGYTVSDEEQAKLGLYSDEDEKKIQLMMSKYDLTRDEAVNSLGDSIADSTTLTDSEELREILQDVQDEQGFIGNAWNDIKNFFGAGVSSNDAEDAIEQFENGEISYDEALSVIDEYADKQDSATDAIKSAAAVAVGAAASLINPIVGIAAGSAVKTGLGAADRASNSDEEDDGLNKEVASDMLTGAAAGAAGSIGRTVLGLAGKGAKAVTKVIAGIIK